MRFTDAFFLAIAAFAIFEVVVVVIYVGIVFVIPAITALSVREFGNPYTIFAVAGFWIAVLAGFVFINNYRRKRADKRR